MYSVGDVVKLRKHAKIRSMWLTGNDVLNGSEDKEYEVVVTGASNRNYDMLVKDTKDLYWVESKDIICEPQNKLKEDFDMAMYIINAYIREMDKLVGTWDSGRFYAKVRAEAKEFYE